MEKGGKNKQRKIFRLKKRSGKIKFSAKKNKIQNAENPST
jgi:hypothetical protein